MSNRYDSFVKFKHVREGYPGANSGRFSVWRVHWWQKSNLSGFDHVLLLWQEAHAWQWCERGGWHQTYNQPSSCKPGTMSARMQAWSLLWVWTYSRCLACWRKDFWPAMRGLISSGVPKIHRYWPCRFQTHYAGTMIAEERAVSIASACIPSIAKNLAKINDH